MTGAASHRAVPIGLSSRLDLVAAGSVFRRHGRVHIADILEQDAAIALHGCLQKEVPWRLSFNLGDRNANLAEEDVKKFADVDRLTLNSQFLASAQRGFQYVFGNWPIYDLWKAGTPQPPLMVQAIEFLNSRTFLEFMRQMTGLAEIAYADAQATRYGPGHFLTRHDDSVARKGRLAAYVLSLTPRWMPDWGGILQFFDPLGHVEEGYVPSFNALNVFRVPAPHAVSYVTPFTASSRYSISGWLWSE